MNGLFVRTLARGRFALAPVATAASSPFLSRAMLVPQLRAPHFSAQAPVRFSTQATETATEAVSESNSPGELRNDSLAENDQRAKRITPPPTKTPEELAEMPYMVRRTPSGNLPVYHEKRGGKVAVETRIKKIEGDQKRLMEELTGALNLEQKDIMVNPHTKHITIKSLVAEKVREHLLSLGF